jgi:hypothetical protein
LVNLGHAGDIDALMAPPGRELQRSLLTVFTSLIVNYLVVFHHISVLVVICLFARKPNRPPSRKSGSYPPRMIVLNQTLRYWYERVARPVGPACTTALLFGPSATLRSGALVRW